MEVISGFSFISSLFSLLKYVRSSCNFISYQTSQIRSRACLVKKTHSLYFIVKKGIHPAYSLSFSWKKHTLGSFFKQTFSFNKKRQPNECGYPLFILYYSSFKYNLMVEPSLTFVPAAGDCFTTLLPVPEASILRLISKDSRSETDPPTRFGTSMVFVSSHWYFFSICPFLFSHPSQAGCPA